MHTLSDFLSSLPGVEGHLVVDEKGLSGNCDFVINGVSPNPANVLAVGSIQAGLRDQLGLRLELRTAGNVEVLVVDRAVPPARC
jgi:uncharacterized protein (TIGR03435 family)